ncbi:glutathione S-transferase protein [gamma proteobacterium NOR5-3]|nr:glutathione S-transferase protein [gamma proteobacterium NOR5-3]
MNNIALYAAPGTCARVSCIALEEIGLPFEYRPVIFMRGEHKSPDYKKLNPKGKVPCLVIDDEALSENVAILTHLNQLFPKAHLLPVAKGSLESARQLADLCFCASTLHPIVTRIRMPHFFATPEAARSIFNAGCQAMREYFQLIEERLAAGMWWYGESWSVLDAYLYWIFWRVDGAGFPTQDYPHFCEHAKRMEQRPSVQRAIAREEALQAELEAKGLAFKPPPLPSD